MSSSKYTLPLHARRVFRKLQEFRWREGWAHLSLQHPPVYTRALRGPAGAHGRGAQPQGTAISNGQLGEDPAGLSCRMRVGH